MRERASQSWPTLQCRLDRRHPLARGLVGWWKALPDYKGPTWRDLSGFGGHGTLTNMTPASDWVATGGQRFSLDFTAASSQYVEVADADRYSFPKHWVTWEGNENYQDYPFSICAWVRMRDASNFCIAFKGTNAASMEWGFQTNGSDQLRFTLYDANNQQRRVIANAACTSDENQWVWLCATYNGLPNGLGIYRNCQAVPATYSVPTSYAGMANKAVPVTIGAAIPWDATYRVFANGQLDDLRIYARELNARDRWDVYLDSLTGRYAALERPQRRLFPIAPTPKATAIIGTEEGDDYATLDEWYADMPAVPGNRYTAQVRAGVYDWFNMSRQVGVATASCNFVIEAFPGQEYRGRISGLYPRIRGVSCAEPYTEFRHICSGGTPLKRPPPRGGGDESGGAPWALYQPGIVLDGCGAVFGYVAGDIAGIFVAAPATIKNCAVVGIYSTKNDAENPATAAGIQVSHSYPGETKIYHCTIHGVGVPQSTGYYADSYGVKVTNATNVIIKNCAFGNVWGHRIGAPVALAIYVASGISHDTSGNASDPVSVADPIGSWRTHGVALGESNAILGYDLHLRRTASIPFVGSAVSLAGYSGAPTEDIDGDAIGADIGIDTRVLSAMATVPMHFLFRRVI